MTLCLRQKYLSARDRGNRNENKRREPGSTGTLIAHGYLAIRLGPIGIAKIVCSQYNRQFEWILIEPASPSVRQKSNAPDPLTQNDICRRNVHDFDSQWKSNCLSRSPSGRTQLLRQQRKHQKREIINTFLSKSKGRFLLTVLESSNVVVCFANNRAKFPSLSIRCNSPPRSLKYV